MNRRVLVLAAVAVWGCGTLPPVARTLPLSDDGTTLSLALPTGAFVEIGKATAALRIRGASGVVLQTAAADPTAPSGLCVRLDDGWHSALRVLRAEPLARSVRVWLDLGGGGVPPLLLELRPDGAVLEATLDEPGANPRELGWALSLDPGAHWYGLGELGALRYQDLYDPHDPGTPMDPQPWPLERGAMTLVPLRTRDRFDILTPWWVASTGAGVFVDSYRDLGVRWNRPWPGRFVLTQVHEPRTNPRNHPFEVALVLGSTLVDAERTWLARAWPVRGAWDPTVPPPPSEMTDGPIWSTWSQYFSAVTQGDVEDLADQVESRGYPYSILEIDDRWQDAYGDTDFDPVKFPDPGGLVRHLHDQGWKVSLWVHPFVNRSAHLFAEGDVRRYFVQSDSDQTDPVRWWTTLSPLAGLIDVSNPGALRWFQAHLLDPVRRYGVDGFKFDAGEANYFPSDGHGAGPLHPNQYEDLYAAFTRTVPFYEMRSGWFAQRYGRVMRLFDKDARWDPNNGLKAVLLQTLTLGLLGYPYVLPDMVGSNFGPEDELMIRWAELNAFLPMMQFSLQPWRFAPATEAQVRQAAWVHQGLVPGFHRLLLEARADGTPPIRPLFWQFPHDPRAYEIDDEFLVGDQELVCPVFTPGVAARSVYLPAGTWRDFWSDATFIGPSTFTAAAPLGHPPVFVPTP